MRFLLFLILIASKLFCQVSVIPTSTIPCNKNYSTVSFTIGSGTPPYNYSVQSPSCAANYTITNGSSNPSFTLPCSGIYTFIVKDALNALIGSATHTVFLGTKIIVDIYKPFDNDTVCYGSGLSLCLSDTANKFTFSNLIWSTGSTDKCISVIIYSTTIYSVTALYTTVLSRTCTAEGSRKIIVIPCSASIKAINSDMTKIKIFPNPVKDKLILEMERNIINEVSITNCLGQVVYDGFNLNSKQEIDLSAFLSGIYFLQAEGEGGRKVFKIIKE